MSYGLSSTFMLLKFIKRFYSFGTLLHKSNSALIFNWTFLVEHNVSCNNKNCATWPTHTCKKVE